jgi:AraC-like DNA-binding protein
MRDSALLDEAQLVILDLLPRGRPAVTLVAGRLGVSVRTLQRRLSGMGLSYSSLLEDVRYRQAQALLRDTDTSMTEIARLLGYSDASHFSRAFRRWGQQCPTVYRRADRGRYGTRGGPMSGGPRA